MSEPVRHSVEVACPTDHAYRTFTAHIDRWWPRGHRRFDRSEIAMEPEVGGRIVERAADGTEVEWGRVLRWEPPHTLSYTWVPGAPPGATTTVDVAFVEVGDRTRVEVTHSEGDSGLGPKWPQRAEIFTRNWRHVLGAFAAWIGR